MDQLTHGEKLILTRRIGIALLAFFSCAGAFFGAWITEKNCFLFSSIIRNAICNGVSPVRLFLVSLLPILFLYLLSLLAMPSLLFPFCIVKSFLFSMCLRGIEYSFRKTGWIICLLLMLPDMVSTAYIYWLSVRNISAGRTCSYMEVLFISAFIGLLCLLTYNYLSPLLLLL